MFYRIAVDGMPSSSASNRIFFIATIWPVKRFLPLYTTPYVPNLRVKIHTQNNRQVLHFLMLEFVRMVIFIRMAYLRRFSQF